MTARYWLIKSEPAIWSWDRQVKKGTTHWDGVRNHQAAANLRAMQKGDRAFFYHSNEGREIVGIVEIARTAYPDPSDETGKFVMVDVRALAPLPKPVTLADIKADKKLANMALVRLSRLSVQPVTESEWARICALGGIRSDV
ncbi:MAG: EVE domain-containing protein [Rhodospirillales bacterium]|nr:EVE domain-containing protein [Alphaproteobacteria bacterium]MCB9986441.1 EVE domain-containing protein [Rhodospirillales bacterium]USO07013.1 MAG: EVE domain-containing protein [Rhodospirillales bacterium]